MHKPFQVALIVETSNIYGRQISSGIARYLRSHHPWCVFAEQHELGTPPPPWLKSAHWDGIICRPTSPQLAGVINDMKVPVVDLNDQHDDLDLPWVGSQHAKFGWWAAEHLIERGFRHFGFCGFRAR